MNTETPTIKQIIIAWSLSYKHRIPILTEARMQAYLELLKTFVQYGYTKADVTSMVHNDIIKASVNSEHKPQAAKKVWTEMAERDLESAMEMAFPSVKLAIVTKEDMAQHQHIIERNAQIAKDHEEAIAAKAKKDLEKAILSESEEYEEDDYVGKVRETLKPIEDLKVKVEIDESVLEELGLGRE